MPHTDGTPQTTDAPPAHRADRGRTAPLGRPMLTIAAVAALVVAAAGCSSADADRSAPASEVGSEEQQDAASSSADETDGESEAESGTEVSPAGGLNPDACTADQVTAEVEAYYIERDRRTVDVVFSGSDAEECTLGATPALSLGDASGERIGSPSQHVNYPTDSVQMNDANQAVFGISVGDDGDGGEGGDGEGCWPAASELQITLPGSEDLFVLDVEELEIVVCDDHLEHGAIRTR
ncbi:DUF4232 domain-containing protein [Streptomyces bohaiensis]|uniref:DUF4232 domain-containing protein n=1 Tax=Streptomyces bohaiensis TaxID=1431344 RepID=UPI003B7C8229